MAQDGLDYRSTPEVRLTVTVSDGHDGTASAEVIVTVRPLAVGIDVKPGDDGNILDPKADKLLPVAILVTDGFDVTRIDLASLRFGATGDERPPYSHPKRGLRFEYQDVNRDGLLGLVVYFDLTLTGLAEGTVTTTLKGQLTDGTDFVGTDIVSIASGPKKGGPKNWSGTADSETGR